MVRNWIIDSLMGTFIFVLYINYFRMETSGGNVLVTVTFVPLSLVAKLKLSEVEQNKITDEMKICQKLFLYLVHMLLKININAKYTYLY